MGASDRSGMLLNGGVPQEIITACYDASEEAARQTVQYLTERGFSDERIQIRFNTWKGRYYTPPDDMLPWTEEEYVRLIQLLETHPNVRLVDTSPGSGSEG